MKNRRVFLQMAGLGIALPFIQKNPSSLDECLQVKTGIVKNAAESEIYFVRENTAITILISKKDGIDSTSLCSEEVLPGNGIAVHKHLNEDEMFYFIKGSGLFILDEKEIAVSAGSAAFVPRGIWHGLKNTGSDVLVFTFGYTPSGFEDFFRQIGTLKGQPFQAKPKSEIISLGQKNGMIYK